MIVLAVCRAALREPLHVIAGNPARVLRLVLVLAARESAADILRRLDIKPIQCRRVRTISLAARMAKAVQVKLKRGLKGRASRKRGALRGILVHMAFAALLEPLHIIVLDLAGRMVAIVNLTTTAECVADLVRHCSIDPELGQVGLTAEAEEVVI